MNQTEINIGSTGSAHVAIDDDEDRKSFRVCLFAAQNQICPEPDPDSRASSLQIIFRVPPLSQPGSWPSVLFDGLHFDGADPCQLHVTLPHSSPLEPFTGRGRLMKTRPNHTRHHGSGTLAGPLVAIPAGSVFPRGGGSVPWSIRCIETLPLARPAPIHTRPHCLQR